MSMQKAFILFVLSVCLAQSDIPKKKVVIIGAGVSGLSAARVISQSGLAEVRVVEAENRYGGRIFTTNHKGHMFERGAQWIHGHEGNVVYEFLSESANLEIESWGRYSPAKDSKFQYYSDREVTSDTEDLFWSASDLLDDISYEIERLIEVENKTEEEIANIPLGDIARKMWKEKFGYYNSHYGLSKNATDSFLVNKFGLLELTDGGHPNIVNSLAWYQYEEYGDNDIKVLDGFNILPRKLRRSIPRNALKLNRKVKSIDWFKENGEQIEVKYETRGGRKGKIYADYVLVTVSMGVLKKYHKTLFLPNLPDEKQAAIEKMGFGTMNKMILFYEKPFWGPKKFSEVYMMWDSFKETLADEFARKDHWCRKIYKISSYGKNFLLLWLTKDNSKAIRNIPMPEIESTVTNLLRRFLNKSDLSGPDDIITTKWDIEENFLGSYSYPAIGQMADDRRTLSEPLYVNGNPRVMFAGEALSISRYSTVDGAFSTGKSEGERIVKLLRGNPQ